MIALSLGENLTGSKQDRNTFHQREGTVRMGADNGLETPVTIEEETLSTPHQDSTTVFPPEAMGRIPSPVNEDTRQERTSRWQHAAGDPTGLSQAREVHFDIPSRASPAPQSPLSTIDSMITR